MPSLPITVSKVLEICNNPKTSPVDLNQVISLDPVLMGKVMRLINSAYYCLPNQITSLVRAIIMLGINTVKNLALCTAVLGTLDKKGDFQALNMEGFWRHSLARRGHRQAHRRQRKRGREAARRILHRRAAARHRQDPPEQPDGRRSTCRPSRSPSGTSSRCS